MPWMASLSETLGGVQPAGVDGGVAVARSIRSLADSVTAGIGHGVPLSGVEATGCRSSWRRCDYSSSATASGPSSAGSTTRSACRLANPGSDPSA